jgi:6-pyruvoyl-tetrahydropterin synthase
MENRSYRERYSNLLDKQYFNFATAHFLIFEDGMREPLHGHNYRAELEFEADGLDDANLVADFIEVKPLFKLVCDRFDHKVLMPLRNPHLNVTVVEENVEVRWRDDLFSFPRRDVVLLDIENTSSELLARTLCEGVIAEIHKALPGLTLSQIRVTLSESPGQSARYERSWERAEGGSLHMMANEEEAA